jgi:hypothetical protein
MIESDEETSSENTGKEREIVKTNGNKKEGWDDLARSAFFESRLAFLNVYIVPAAVIRHRNV